MSCAPGSACLRALPESYRLKVAGPAARALEKVPERVAAAVVEFMTGRLLENPHRIGKPLLGRFAGLHAARVQEYRVRYRIDEDSHTVVVVHVGPRSDAYRPP
jgi:mRNA interferase RelE/StbE